MMMLLDDFFFHVYVCVNIVLQNSLVLYDCASVKLILWNVSSLTGTFVIFLKTLFHSRFQAYIKYFFIAVYMHYLNLYNIFIILKTEILYCTVYGKMWRFFLTWLFYFVFVVHYF